MQKSQVIFTEFKKIERTNYFSVLNINALPLLGQTFTDSRMFFCLKWGDINLKHEERIIRQLKN